MAAVSISKIFHFYSFNLAQGEARMPLSATNICPNFFSPFILILFFSFVKRF
jgi:hypothetical protein